MNRKCSPGMSVRCGCSRRRDQDRATGWVHFGNCLYNPTTGRWTQQDTLDAPLDPTNANRDAYGGCDPINGLDPTGELVNPCADAVIGALFSVAGVWLSAAAISPGAATALGVAGLVVSIGGFYWSLIGIGENCQS